MPRFYIEDPLIVNQTLSLPALLVRHIQVLRMRVGSDVTLFNGQGGEYHGTITTIGKAAVEVMLQTFDPISRESTVNITLIQALSSAERMDYTIQKAVECGVSCIQPVISLRSQQRFQGERAQKKVLHWQAIAVAASEQSGRTIVPTILPIQSLNDYFTKPIDADIKILLSPSATTKLNSLPNQAKTIQILIGPEGGLSREEEKQAEMRGFTLLSLGPRILRTETVAPVVMGLLQAKYGDFCL